MYLKWHSFEIVTESHWWIENPNTQQPKTGNLQLVKLLFFRRFQPFLFLYFFSYCLPLPHLYLSIHPCLEAPWPEPLAPVHLTYKIAPLGSTNNKFTRLHYTPWTIAKAIQTRQDTNNTIKRPHPYLPYKTITKPWYDIALLNSMNMPRN